jgi:hypothetical protein
LFSYRFISVVDASSIGKPPRDAGVSWRPKRGVFCERNPGCGGFPHSNDPEISMMEELWAGVTPSRWSPMTWIPMKRDPEGSEPKGGGLISLDIKPNETRTPHQ